MIKPLDIAADGYLCLKNTLSIAVNGYICISKEVVPVVTRRDDGGNGKGKKTKKLPNVDRRIEEDEEILVILKSFVICQP